MSEAASDPYAGSVCLPRGKHAGQRVIFILRLLVEIITFYYLQISAIII